MAKGRFAGARLGLLTLALFSVFVLPAGIGTARFSTAQAAERKDEIETLAERMLALDEAGKTDQAIAVGKKFAAAIKARYGKNHLEYAAALEALAILSEAAGHTAEAESLLREAIEIKGRNSGPEDPSLAGDLSRLAHLLDNAGRSAETAPLYRRLLAIDEKRYGPTHEAVARDLNQLALVLQKGGQLEEAEPLLRRAVKIAEATLQPNDANLAIGLANLADVLLSTNKLEEAEALYRRALAVDESRVGPDDLYLVRDLKNVARAVVKSKGPAATVPLLRRAVAICTKQLGVHHPMTANLMINLIALTGSTETAEVPKKAARAAQSNGIEALYDQFVQAFKQGKFSEAEPIARRYLEAAGIRYGKNHPEYAIALNNLSSVLQRQRKLAEAEALQRRALAIDEAHYGPDHAEVATDLRNLANTLKHANRLAEAEPLLRRALAIIEKKPGSNNAEVAAGLAELAGILNETNRPAEAGPLARRALAIDENIGNQSGITRDLNTLIVILLSENRAAEAVPLARRAVAIDKKILPPKHPSAVIHLSNLGAALYGAGKLTDAIEVQRRVAALTEEISGPEHPDLATALNNLAQSLKAANRQAEAEPLLLRNVKILEKSVTPGHPNLAVGLANMGWIEAEAGDWQSALTYLRRAAKVLVLGAKQARSANTDAEKRLRSMRADIFQGQALAAYLAASTSAAARDEAFAAAQWAVSTAAADALAKASLRFAAGSGPLAALVREQQDLSGKRGKADKALLSAMSTGDPAQADRLRAELRQLDGNLETVSLRLDKEFPRYAGLMAPKPLTIAKVQALLQTDEALLLFFDVLQTGHMRGGMLAWAVTKAGADWIALPFSPKEISAQVKALRCGLDGSTWNGEGAALCRALLKRAAASEDQPLPFDLERAYVLYRALFGKFAKQIEGKRLLIAPSRSLAPLPFHALVIQKPAQHFPETWKGYRDVKWLGSEHPITIVPSVASLASLRENAQPSRASGAFIGFGDPKLTGGSYCQPVSMPAYCPGEGPGELRAGGRWVQAVIDKLFRGGLADVNAVRGLCPLPDTAHELRCVARSLGAPLTQVITGEAAIETVVKAAPLGQYRIVHFATHGLLASESGQLSRGLAEPALVLTPPGMPTEADDGLLTASEITQLKLNADWVVLSACNTAGAETTGGEVLSGLARAFFYSGARALLVSHWPVDSNAATTLTSGAFKEMRRAADISPAEALRLSMKALMADPQRPWNAHPAFWAPFIVVGGAR